MKTLSDIKEEYARENNFCEWSEILYSIDDPAEIDEHFDKVARMFALEACKEALKNASTCNVIYVDTVDENGEETTGKVIYQSDITLVNNIPEEVRNE